MNGLVEQLLHVPAPVAYTLIAALVFGEAAVFLGFVLPGETAVLLGGVLAGKGTLSLPVLIAVVVVAAAVGDLVGYEVGRRVGPRVLEWPLLSRHQERLDAAGSFLRERGGWAVFLGRSTAFLRAVMPGLAGVSRMPYRRFLPFNVAGAVVWGAGVSVLGYLAGQSYEQVATVLSRSGAALVVALVAAGLLAWHIRRRRTAR